MSSTATAGEPIFMFKYRQTALPCQCRFFGLYILGSLAKTRRRKRLTVVSVTVVVISLVIVVAGLQVKEVELLETE